MAKVLTFSQQFPAYHLKAGQPTYFVEKIWRSIGMGGRGTSERIVELNQAKGVKEIQGIRDFMATIVYAHYKPKNHTIRAGHRFKTGDMASLRIWSVVPYNSKQIIIAPDVKVKVFDFSIDLLAPKIYLNGLCIFEQGKYVSEVLHEVAVNDGLSIDDLFGWFKFPKPFTGQIICWNENLNYDTISQPNT